MTVRLIPALAYHELAFAVGALAPPERKALAVIAESTDLFTVEGKSWLLTPAPPWLIDTLAAVGAEAEDREPGLDDEEETDMGVEDTGELDLSDYEPDNEAAASGFRNPQLARGDMRPVKHGPCRVSGKRWLLGGAAHTGKHEHNMVAIRELTAEDAARVFAKPSN